MLNRKKLPPEPRSCQKVRKSSFSYFFNCILTGKRLPPKPRSIKNWKNQFLNTFLNYILNRNKLPPKPRSCQKLEKTIFKYFFNEFWLEKSCHHNQDPAKSWKNQFLNTFWVGPPFHILRCLCHLCSSLEQKPEKSILNTFLIKCWIEKSCRQNQDRAKRWGNQFLSIFWNWFYIYIYSLFLLILSAQKKDQEKYLCHLFCEKRVWNFTFWNVCAIYLVVMETKAGKINFEYFFNYHPNQDRAKKVRKSISEYFFNWIWIETSCHQNQNRAKSWKNQFLNTCLNEILNRNKLPPKPRSRQKLEKSIFKYSLNWNVTRKKLPTKPRSYQKLEKSIFEYFFELCHHFTFWDVCAIYLLVIGTKAGDINFEYFFN